ncbi:dentin sialophosphoprotein isoform X2 [Drosophila busckii]|uniref:dentin sialophosphoprotein isoform X2 n=1 Tax=Drosophila busckii TaxID=30019 RepID=UPI00083EB010|nr:dentin sialophosphoprotein isoform X2 [Drosophila busckii]
MAQVTATKEQQRDHIDEDEVSELQRPPSFYQLVHEQAERFASTRIGQFAIEKADRGLKLIEDTTKWSLPQEKNSSATPLERPLPWAPFLLLIVTLRLARIWLSMGALLIGNAPVSPQAMIYFIQTRRRKLRAIRVHGLRVMRQRQQEASSHANKSYTHQLSQWLSKAICRPGVQRANSGRLFNTTAAAEAENKPLNKSVSKRPREEECNADQNMTIDQILAKYAEENSEDDSDFVPHAEEETETSSSSSSSGEGASSESHSSDEISESEARENLDTHLTNGKVTQSQAQALSNGNGSNKEQTEVAAAATQAAKKDGQNWKSAPGPRSAALMNSRVYNNTAAAASTEEPTNPSDSHLPLADPEPDPDTDTDTDCSSTHTVCRPQAKETTAYSQSEADILHSTVDTLTPATSSEDIFYSPIGSPNNFNNCYSPQALLHNVTINSALVHSTPNSEVEGPSTPSSVLEETAKQSIIEAHVNTTPVQPPKQPPQQQQQHQQQPRHFNHPNQRFRGRNRR